MKKKIKQSKNLSKANLSTIFLQLTPCLVLTSFSGCATYDVVQDLYLPLFELLPQMSSSAAEQDSTGCEVPR